MNNELNNQIDTLDVTEQPINQTPISDNNVVQSSEASIFTQQPVVGNEVENLVDNQIDTLEPSSNITEVNQVESIDSLGAETQSVDNLQEKPDNQVNQVINPNAYHPSLNNNQNNNVEQSNQINEQNQISQNITEQPSVIDSAANSENFAQPPKKVMSLSMTSFIILGATLLSHFLVVPHIILRLYVNIFGDFFSKRMINAIMSGSKMGYYFWSYVALTPVLTLLIASFAIIIFAIINIIRKGERTTDLLSFIKKAILFSFIGSFALLLLYTITNTDFITPIIKIVTFNGKQLEMFEGLWS